jgi:hypothetical protein
MFIAFASVSDAPGVSSTALGLSIVRGAEHHTLLVEADPVGSSPTLSGYLRSEVRDRSLKNLINHDRYGRLREAFASQLVHLPDTRTSVLPGLVHAGQAEPMQRTWGPLAELLADYSTSAGTTVVVDAGRISHTSPHMELVRRADLIAILVRPTLPKVAALASAMDPINRYLAKHRSPARLGLVVVGNGFALGNDVYDAKDVANATGIDLITTLPDAPSDARMFSEGAQLSQWRQRRSLYLRSLNGTWPKISSFIDSHQPDWIAARPDLTRTPVPTRGGAQ